MLIAWTFVGHMCRQLIRTAQKKSTRATCHILETSPGTNFVTKVAFG
jgi:hypothetical protein